MEIAKLVLEILLKMAPEIYDFVKGEIDGGADAVTLRSMPINASIAFGGGPGKVIGIQGSIESDMADPKAE